MNNYFDLGDLHWEITTHSSEAQEWFNRGMVWCFAFHHEEAAHCFRQVIHYDPRCAMGHWGYAYAAGPNYNLPWNLFNLSILPTSIRELHSCTLEAVKLAPTATPLERAIIEAFARRIQADHVVDDLTFAAWDDDYAAAMREVYQAFPDDPNVSCLVAEALMCRTPWQLWDLEESRPADGADTVDAINIVEKAISRLRASGVSPHPGLLHLHIHLLEMSPWPEKALESAHQLRYLIPEAGHLIHMPSHIYILCGEYQLALDSNSEAIAADAKYDAYNDAINMFTLYRSHNYHFKIYAAMLLGQFGPALQTAGQLQEIIPRAAVAHDHAFLASTLEGYVAMKSHVLVRFGRWQDIIDEPLPSEPELYCFTTAMWHYAKGVAQSAIGQVAEAELACEQFEKAFELVPPDRLLFNNNCRDILLVAKAMLHGELEYRKGDYSVAFDHLRESVKRYDELLYTEPWAWMQPTRHALGALLLEQGQVTEAAAVYRADLGLDNTCIRSAQHPDNIWSLYGYCDCLRKQNNWEELAVMQPRLDQARAKMDVALHASCYCQQRNECCD